MDPNAAGPVTGFGALRAPRRAPRARARRRTGSRGGRRHADGRPVSRSAASRALGERGVDRRAARAAATGARPAGGALGGADGQPLRTIAARAGAGPRGPGRRDSARVALGQLAALEHREHVVGKLEQPQAVRDGRLRAADALGDLAERELELVEQDGVGARLLDRRELLARDVLDEAEQERVAVVGLADERRQWSPRRPRGRRASGARRRSARSRRPAAGRTTTGWRTPCARIESARPAVASRSNGAAAGAGWVDHRRPAAGRAPLVAGAPPSGPRARGRGRGGSGLRCARQAPSPPSSTPRRPAERRS